MILCLSNVYHDDVYNITEFDTQDCLTHHTTLSVYLIVVLGTLHVAQAIVVVSAFVVLT